MYLKYCFFLLFSYFLSLLADEIYTVQRGDNLSKIAQKFNTNINNLKEINNLSSDKIKIGQKIIVKKNTGYEPLFYTIKAGDNLTGIARKNNTTTSQLINWNDLKTSNIKINQTIIVGYQKNNSIIHDVQIVNERENFHIVKQGETLSSISRKHDMALVDLIEYNQLTNFLIKPGQKLLLFPSQFIGKTNVSNQQSIQHTVLRGENLYRIALQHGVSIDDIRKWNNMKGSNIRVGQVLEIRNVSVIHSQNSAITFSKMPTAVLPVGNIKVLSEFGMRGKNMHKGIDFSGNQGDPVYAVLPGIVVYSGVQRGYGNVIILEHHNSIMTVYGHNEVNWVKVGEAVTQRQIIASIGNTGNTTIYHLHFEYRVKGIAQNPRDLLPMR